MIHHCTSRARRGPLSDDDFWADVADALLSPAWQDIDDIAWQDIDDIDLATMTGDPCPECGEYGACMTDAQGRKLIHVVDPED